MTNGERADRLVVLKGLLAEMSVDYPRSHDVAPVFIEAVRERGVEVDAGFLTWLVPLSARLADVRAPAFYHGIAVEEGEAQQAVGGADVDVGGAAPGAAGVRYSRRIRAPWITVTIVTVIHGMTIDDAVVAEDQLPVGLRRIFGHQATRFREHLELREALVQTESERPSVGWRVSPDVGKRLS